MTLRARRPRRCPDTERNGKDDTDPNFIYLVSRASSAPLVGLDGQSIRSRMRVKLDEITSDVSFREIVQGMPVAGMLWSPVFFTYSVNLARCDWDREALLSHVGALIEAYDANEYIEVFNTGGVSTKFLPNDPKSNTVPVSTGLRQIFYYLTRGSGLFVRSKAGGLLCGITKVDVSVRRFMMEEGASQTSAILRFAYQATHLLRAVNGLSVRENWRALIQHGGKWNSRCWLSLGEMECTAYLDFLADEGRRCAPEEVLDDDSAILCGLAALQAGDNSTVRRILADRTYGSDWMRKYSLYALLDFYTFREDGTWVTLYDTFLNLILKNGKVTPPESTTVGFAPIADKIEHVAMLASWDEFGGIYPEMVSSQFNRVVETATGLTAVPQFFYRNHTGDFHPIEDFPSGSSWTEVRSERIRETLS